MPKLTGSIGLDVYRLAKAGLIDEARLRIRRFFADEQGQIAHLFLEDKWGGTPFSLWAEAGRDELLEELPLKELPWTPHLAAAWGQLDVVRAFWEADREAVLAWKWRGNAMHWALNYNRLEVARWLAKRGFDVAGTDSGHGYVACAAFSRQEAAIRLAVEMGAAVDFGARAALHHECNHGWVKLVPVLLELGADPNRPGPDGSTPIQLAEKKGKNSKLAKLLRAAAR